MALKELYPNKKLIHRLDGLQKLYNKPDDIRQDQAMYVNKIADGTVFQTQWAMKKFKEYGWNNGKYAVIGNAVYGLKKQNKKKYKNTDKKTKLVCTCWSPNKNKGFEYYKFLDENLNFDEYDFHFVGNLHNSHKYKNIVCHAPMTTDQLLNFIRKFDIFISATKNECCSNSLLEALSAGIPAIALNSGGNPEVLKNGGELFEDKNDLIQKIEAVRNNLLQYMNNIQVETIEEVGNKYIKFFENV